MEITIFLKLVRSLVATVDIFSVISTHFIILSAIFRNLNDR